jgi:hypothetical protein
MVVYQKGGFKMRVHLIGMLMLYGAVFMNGQSTAPNDRPACCRPLSPEKMTKLPPEVRQQLADEHCMIAQNGFKYDDPQPNNAIQGPFAAKGQKDWAVLCAKPQEFSVRIFWGGETRCSDTIVLAHSQPPVPTGDNPGTVLWPADAKKIRAYDQAFGDHKLPVLDHSGLEVGGEQATIIYYCSQGKWIQLAGSD